MNRFRWRKNSWKPAPPTWGAAAITGLGCALPLLLGLFSGHPGFLWATLGAFQAARANPLHRLGMLRMLLQISLGACSVALGYWAASYPLLSMGLFACYGLLLAWLQRYGNEAGKLGIGLAICLCLGQGQYGVGDFNNPQAIAMLFVLGGLLVMLLAFGLRGLHGLRMWPYMPRLLSVIRVLRRRARRTSARQWRLQALTHLLAAALGGLLVVLADLAHGYWLTLAILIVLQMDVQRSLARALQAGLGVLCAAALLIYLGYGLADPPLMVMILLPLLVLSRAFQAHHYRLFVLQTTLSFILLTETLALNWDMPQIRLINAAIGIGVALAVTLLVYVLRRLIARLALRKTGRSTVTAADHGTSRDRDDSITPKR